MAYEALPNPLPKRNRGEAHIQVHYPGTLELALKSVRRAELLLQVFIQQPSGLGFCLPIAIINQLESGKIMRRGEST